ncbi:MAG: HD domain-containing phosphohydrolase [Calditrichia bacterium]
MSIKMLKQVPFPRKMSKVPEYAGGHHEKLDGSGYPFGLTADQLALQSRIMAIADF